MNNKRYLIIGLALITIIIIYFIKNYYGYREKALDDVISYDIKNFESLVFNEGVEQFERRTDNKAHAEKFNDFLSQYRVKKMKDSEWNGNVSKEKGFLVTIYTTRGPIMASIYEHRLTFYNDGAYYKVINGPIDIDWVKVYIDKFKQ
ncbi:hypothetical protein AN964_12185 [Heyndrickxia shackletonii]|uniref:Uncharacterized protein n=1 Tax=Heyndrickxia shackletonii TaxID=157838 RepID=A0A0Q3WXU9_9BACI|nr:hypothetical protein [Heyndrickxia shackletonii]KQL54179.1 hypothetical protein AN964_12185 [Heyndrickxia shackletonii]NEY99256.1 hypothetical protein [Heyndrickxia shackletonii]